eukprot:tig00000241_g21041.t1
MNLVIDLRIGGSSRVENNLFTNGGIPVDGYFHHLVISISATKTAAYLNGTSGAGVGTVTARTGLPLATAIPTITRAKHYIGKSHWSNPYPVGVRLADFRVYSRDLSAAEAAAAFRGAVPAAPLELSYSMKGCRGQIFDESLNRRHATAEDGLYPLHDCPGSKQGIYFGTNSEGGPIADIPTIDRYVLAPNFALGAPMTFTFWISPRAARLQTATSSAWTR